MPKEAPSSSDDPDLPNRVERLLSTCLAEARLIVERRRDEVEALSARLAELGTVDLG